jgi:hypothetical protein
MDVITDELCEGRRSHLGKFLTFPCIYLYQFRKGTAQTHVMPKLSSKVVITG